MKHTTKRATNPTLPPRLPRLAVGQEIDLGDLPDGRYYPRSLWKLPPLRGIDPNRVREMSIIREKSGTPTLVWTEVPAGIVVVRDISGLEFAERVALLDKHWADISSAGGVVQRTRAISAAQAFALDCLYSIRMGSDKWRLEWLRPMLESSSPAFTA